MYLVIMGLPELAPPKVDSGLIHQHLRNGILGFLDQFVEFALLGGGGIFELGGQFGQRFEQGCCVSAFDGADDEQG